MDPIPSPSPKFIQSMDSLKDLSYHTTVLFEYKEGRYFHGNTRMTFTLSEPLSDPLILSYDGKALTLALDGQPIPLQPTPNPIGPQLPTHPPSSLYNLIPAPTPQTNHVLTSEYQGMHTPEGQPPIGVYRVDSKSNTLALIYTQSEADYSKRIFPLVENHKAKAKVTFTAIIPADFEFITHEEIVSSQPLPLDRAKRRELGLGENIFKRLEEMEEDKDELELIQKGGYKVVRSGQSPPIPFHVFAFAVGKFITKPLGGHPFQAKMLKPLTVECAYERLCALAPLFLAYLESYLATPLPYKKMDCLFLPHFIWVAMENPGCMFFADSFLQAPPSISHLLTRENLLSHELAHNWFGNLVTPDTFHNLWLKESMVEFLSYKCHQNAVPTMYSWLDKDLPLANMFLRVPAHNVRESPPFKKCSHPICFKDDDYGNNLMDYYGGIVYQKGCASLRALEVLVGDTQFQQILQAIMKTYPQATISDTQFKSLSLSLLPPSQHADFNQWINDHIYTRGYTLMDVIGHRYDSEKKALTVELLLQFNKIAKVQFRAYNKDGVLIKEFYSKLPGGGTDQKQKITIVEEAFNEEPYFIIPNTNCGDYIRLILPEDYFTKLLEDSTQLVLNLPLLDRTQVYSSFKNKGVVKLKESFNNCVYKDNCPYFTEKFTPNIMREKVEQEIITPCLQKHLKMQ
jgi:hypothetical protein